MNEQMIERRSQEWAKELPEDMHENIREALRLAFVSGAVISVGMIHRAAGRLEPDQFVAFCFTLAEEVDQMRSPPRNEVRSEGDEKISGA